MSSLLVGLRLVYRRPGNLPAQPTTTGRKARPSGPLEAVVRTSSRTRARLADRESCGGPGSREAPRNGPELGREVSLGRTWSQPLIHARNDGAGDQDVAGCDLSPQFSSLPGPPRWIVRRMSAVRR